MSFQLIDYSEYYYKEIAGEPLPESRGGKFIQLRNRDDDAEFIVMSPALLSKYHANILERFCSLNNLGGYWNSERTSYEFVDGAWSAVGGGKWMIDSHKKTLELGGSSQAYGRFDLDGLKKKILSLERMKDYLVTIDGG